MKLTVKTKGAEELKWIPKMFNWGFELLRAVNIENQQTLQMRISPNTL